VTLIGGIGWSIGRLPIQGSIVGGLSLDDTHVRSRGRRAWLSPRFPGELLKLAPLSPSAKRTTRRSGYITMSHEENSLGLARRALVVIRLDVWLESRVGGENQTGVMSAAQGRCEGTALALLATVMDGSECLCCPRNRDGKGTRDAAHSLCMGGHGQGGGAA